MPDCGYCGTKRLESDDLVPLLSTTSYNACNLTMANIELHEYPPQRKDVSEKDKAVEPNSYASAPEPTDGTVSSWAWGTASMSVLWLHLALS